MCQDGCFASAQEPPAVHVDRGTGHELGDRAGDQGDQLSHASGVAKRFNSSEVAA